MEVDKDIPDETFDDSQHFENKRILVKENEENKSQNIVQEIKKEASIAVQSFREQYPIKQRKKFYEEHKKEMDDEYFFLVLESAQTNSVDKLQRLEHRRNKNIKF
ncbi:UNKNOWN [Stylonychia lemnae]|uniref:Uncharacterized protein n=1 Tax=Stylonychia lemnae TaxID=5949 RepID=A0A078B337_STYLE|nr:UNKNOWN [Stylonychia lemnae]|eukprot:CDW87893.1 UNKNOWN [Stylonychia lemnae]